MRRAEALETVYVLGVAAATRWPPWCRPGCRWRWRGRAGSSSTAPRSAGSARRWHLRPSRKAPRPGSCLGLGIELGPAAREPGETPDLTTLANSGADGVTSAGLAESVTRPLPELAAPLGGGRARAGPDGVEPALLPARREGDAGAGRAPRDGRIGGLDAEGRFRIGTEALPLGAALAELG